MTHMWGELAHCGAQNSEEESRLLWPRRGTPLRSKRRDSSCHGFPAKVIGSFLRGGIRSRADVVHTVTAGDTGKSTAITERLMVNAPYSNADFSKNQDSNLNLASLIG